MILPQTIAAIKDAARIEEVVGDYVRLKRSGSNYKGVCPFHDERTPSFMVSPAKGIYKCFGCGKAGDSVRFVMDHDKISYSDALKVLANKYGIVIEERELTAEEKAEQTERDALFVANEFARNWFVDQLWNTENGKIIGYSYFKERGFTDETIKKFQLGFAPEGWHTFGTAAREKGYNPDYLQKLGLEKLNAQGEAFDYFRERVMFPIHNVSGKVLGFGGRVLKKNDKIAKYLNSPESEIYNKSKTLYGIFYAKQDIIKQDRVYLVEGYTDVISLYQNGIKNVVASSGTSLTDGQIKTLRRFTFNVTILYDGDWAGIKASFRGINMFLEAGMNVKVLLFPDGEDPDSFAQKTPTEELEQYLTDKAEDFIAFKTRVLLKEAGNDPIKKAELIKDLVQSISLIPDNIVRSVYVKECARLMEMNEDTIILEMNRLRQNQLNKELKGPNVEEKVGKPETDSTPKTIVEPKNESFNYIDIPEERDTIRYILQHGSKQAHYVGYDDEGNEEKATYKVGQLIITEIEMDGFMFENPIFQKIFDDYKKIVNDPFNSNIEKYFLNHENQHVVETVINLTQSKYHLSNGWEKFEVYTAKEEDKMFKSVMKTLFTLKLKRVDRKISSIRNQIANEDLSYDDAMILMAEMKKWLDTRTELSEVMHRPIIK